MWIEVLMVIAGLVVGKLPNAVRAGLVETGTNRLSVRAAAYLSRL